MIVVLSSSEPERAALVALCEGRRWPCTGCESVLALRRLLRRTCPKVIIMRHWLRDGYSDDVIRTLADAGLMAATRLIVLLGAGALPALEARQIALGADWVQRDPVRTDVLLEYVNRFVASRTRAGPICPRHAAAQLRLGGAILDPTARQLRHGQKAVALTPREVKLVELLCDSAGEVVCYETLYSEILGRRFQGETSNMRVLLNKLAASFRAVGVPLRQHVEVIVKSGYRYNESRLTPAP